MGLMLWLVPRNEGKNRRVHTAREMGFFKAETDNGPTTAGVDRAVSFGSLFFFPKRVVEEVFSKCETIELCFAAH